ncbi:microsomal signal peptidase 12 kDa subunit-domain-containing protein [Dichotomocladium elegans]|nr:microsomal signal peptidase 12 kDa subunit-domain-containing protein [Dichotomocladium elegans]
MDIASYFEWTIVRNSLISWRMVAGFVIGYVNQDLLLTIIIFGIGVALSLLVALPPWPFYNRHPLKWLPMLSEEQKM